MRQRERFTQSKCDRCGKTTPAKQNGIGDLFALPHEWGAPLADEGSFCDRCITKFDRDNWLAWMKEHRRDAVADTSSGDKTKAPPKWDFTLSDGSALRVHCGTGHWSQVLNVESGEVVRAVYVFEADVTPPNGEKKATFVLRNQLRQLRKAMIETA